MITQIICDHLSPLSWLHHAPWIPSALSLYPWVCEINGSFKSPLHYISPLSQCKRYTPQQINCIMKILINLNKWLYIIHLMLKSMTKVFTGSSKLLSLTGIDWLRRLWSCWSYWLIISMSLYEAQGERIILVLLQWSEPIHVVGWLGQKSQSAMKQNCLPKHILEKQFSAHKSVIMWVQEKFCDLQAWKKKALVQFTPHTNTYNNTFPSWRLIQSQHVPYGGCCQTWVCSVTLWARGNYILVQSGDSASIQRLLSVPSSYRPQPPEECPALDTLQLHRAHHCTSQAAAVDAHV